MGFNVSGIICDAQIGSVADTEARFGVRLRDDDESISFDEALAGFKQENCFDVYTCPKGTLIIPDFGWQCDLARVNNVQNIVQFIVSDVSSTYYFEKFRDGTLDRKLIVTEGEVVENYGEGVVNEGDDMLDTVWQLFKGYTGVDLMADNSHELTFTRFRFNA